MGLVECLVSDALGHFLPILLSAMISVLGLAYSCDWVDGAAECTLLQDWGCWSVVLGQGSVSACVWVPGKHKCRAVLWRGELALLALVEWLSKFWFASISTAVGVGRVAPDDWEMPLGVLAGTVGVGFAIPSQMWDCWDLWLVRWWEWS